MNDYVVIIYNGEQVSVPKEVADFLEQDRKREQAQDKQDTRHLSKSEFETVPSGSDCVKRPVEDAALRNLQLENLRKAIAETVRLLPIAGRTDRTGHLPANAGNR